MTKSTKYESTCYDKSSVITNMIKSKDLLRFN